MNNILSSSTKTLKSLQVAALLQGELAFSFLVLVCLNGPKMLRPHFPQIYHLPFLRKTDELNSLQTGSSQILPTEHENAGYLINKGRLTHLHFCFVQLCLTAPSYRSSAVCLNKTWIHCVIPKCNLILKFGI